MKIYIHGNCQAGALAALLRECLPGDFEIDFEEVFHIDFVNKFDDYYRKVSNADVILTQPISKNYRKTKVLSTDWVTNNRRKGATILRFPVIYNRTLTLQSYTVKDLYEGRFAYHDLNALMYFFAGKSFEEFIVDTSREDFYTPEFVREEARRTIKELVRREAADKLDVVVSDIIPGRLKSGQALNTFNHPSRAILAEIGNRLLEKTSIKGQISSEGVDPLDQIIIPPYRSTLSALGHDGNGVQTDAIHWHKQWFRRDQFYSGVFDDYKKLGHEKLRYYMAIHPEIYGYFGRFEHQFQRKAAPPLRRLQTKTWARVMSIAGETAANTIAMRGRI